MTNTKYEQKVWKRLFDQAAASQQPRPMPLRSRSERKEDAELLAEEMAYIEMMEELGLREESYRLNTNGCW